MQDIIVDLIVLAAVLFLARWLYKNLIAHRKRPTCGTCGSCAPDQEARPLDTSAAAHSSTDPPR